MDEKTPIQSVNEPKTSNANNIRKKIHQNRLLKILVFIFLNIFLIALFGVIFINYNQSNSTNEQATHEDNQLPSIATPTPNETASLPDIYYPYSQLPELDSNANINKHTDSVLGLRFSYPAKYHKISLAANANDNKWLQIGYVFFIAERNEKREEEIQYYIDCHANAIDGVCREHVIDDIDVSMYNYNSNDSFEYDFKYSKEECGTNPNCEVEILNNKIIVSKQSQASLDGRDVGMNYRIIISGDNPSSISISTRKPIEYSDIIKIIIDSAALN